MISLRNPARTREENDRLAQGLAGSAVLHALLFGLWFTAGPPPATPTLDALTVYPTAMVVTEIELTAGQLAFSDIEGPPESAPGGADSEGGPAGEAPPSESPEPDRPTPTPAAPVRAERADLRPEGRPVPARIPPRERVARPSAAPTPGRAQTAPRPTGPSRPVETPGTGVEAGTGQSAGPGTGRQSGGGDGDGAGAGSGAGSGGTGAREVGFALGNRSYDCPTPDFEGIPGNVTLTITFRPDGGYVSATGRGDATLVRAARAVVSRCRAQRLPAGASQVNQSTQATFRFVAG